MEVNYNLRIRIQKTGLGSKKKSLETKYEDRLFLLLVQKEDSATIVVG